MDTNILLNQIQKETFSRADIYKYAKDINSEFRETQMRYLLGKMLEDGAVIRVARNCYKKNLKLNEKHAYTTGYSNLAVSLIQNMKVDFPLLDFRIWEICWLNEFLNHQIAYNKIFLEVEYIGCEFVYSKLLDDYAGRILLRPNEKELLRYGTDNGIIIERLIGESPKGRCDFYNVCLEKIIVDMFANKTLQIMLSQGDYPMAITDMFNKYVIDQTKLFRYARRRNRVKEIYFFLKEKTSVEVLVEV